MDDTETSSLIKNRFTQHSILDTGISKTSPHIGKLKQQFFEVTQKRLPSSPRGKHIHAQHPILLLNIKSQQSQGKIGLPFPWRRLDVVQLFWE